jgi:surface antigen
VSTSPRVLLALVCALLVGLTRQAESTAMRPGTARPSGTPIVYGYPYASRCPGAGIGDVVDRWRMYACNCTSYVAWALGANGQRIDWFVPGAMDAWNWPNVARRARLAVDERAARGAVAVWPGVARPFGHVAYVTRVEASGRIDVAEYNFPVYGHATYVFGMRDDVSARGAVFIHVPPRRLNGGLDGAPFP